MNKSHRKDEIRDSGLPFSESDLDDEESGKEFIKSQMARKFKLWGKLRTKMQ